MMKFLDGKRADFWKMTLVSGADMVKQICLKGEHSPSTDLYFTPPTYQV